MMFKCIVFGNNLNVDYIVKDNTHYININDLQCNGLNIIALKNRVMVNGEITSIKDFIIDKGYLYIPVCEVLSIIKNATFSKSKNTLTIY